MERRVCITAVEGNTGFLIAELLLTNSTYKNVINSVTGLTLNTDADRCKELSNLGATIVAHNPGRVRQMTNILREAKADTLCLVPPAHQDKLDITTELIQAAKKANIPNVCLISTAGADLAERDAQPRLREFIDIESLFMATKGDPSTAAGRSPVIIRYVHFIKAFFLSGADRRVQGRVLRRKSSPLCSSMSGGRDASHSDRNRS
jgi:NmrA-like family